MARKTDIRLRRSNTANAIPTSGNLSLGEMAMNTADGALYFKTSDNTVITAHDNTIMHIDSLNDRVGIGTTSPDKPLDVLGDIRSIDGSSNQHQLRATQVISYGTDAILNAQSTGDDVRLNTQGTTRLIATAEGNVGIGVASPSKKLTVDGDVKISNGDAFMSANVAGSTRSLISLGTDNILRIKGNDSEGSSNVISMKAGGDVGIGTTNPVSKLHVIENVNNSSALQTEGQTADAATIRIENDNTTVGSYASLFLRADTADARIAVIKKSSTDNDADIVFMVNDASASTNNEKLRIVGESGNVGIGTSSPSEKLTIEGNTFLSGDNRHVYFGGSNTFIGERSNSTHLELRGGGSSAAQTVYIDNNGRLGLGTAAPDQKFHVEFANTDTSFSGGSGGAWGSDGIRIENTSTTANTMAMLHLRNGDADIHIAGIRQGTDDSDLGFFFEGSEKVRIDSSGNILGSGVISLTGTSGSTLYALQLTRSASGTTTPDLWGQNGTLVLGTSSTTEALAFSSADSIFYGDLTIPNKIRHSGDTDTYISFANADDFRIVVGNSTRAAFNTSKIHFNQEGINQDFQVEGNTDSSLFYIDASADSIGIGTSSIDAKLEVKNSTTATDTIIASAGLATAGNYHDLILGDSRNYAVGLRRHITQSNPSFLRPRLDFIVQDQDTYLPADREVRMSINYNGSVGIGTTSPQGTLHLRDTTARLYVQSNDGSSAHVTFGDATDISRGGIEYTSTDDLVFSNNNFAERMRIRYTGDIGIGTALPGAKLDIAGASATDSPTLRLTGTGEASQGDIIGEIQFYNSDTTDFTPGVMSSIRAIAGASGGEGQLQIYTNMPSEGTAAATLAAHFASDGNTIFGGTSVGAAGAMSVKVDGTYTDLYLYGAGTSQGGRIFFGDSSDRSSITGTYGTGGGGKLSFKTDTTGGTSQDRLVIDSDGSIRFNNAFTFPTSIGSAGQVLKVPSTGSTLVWASDAGGGSATVLTDTDGDTKIQVEESADEDIIRFDIAGTEQMVLNSTGLTVAGNLTVNGTQTVLNTSTLTVDDLNITVADGAANSQAADGAGITVAGAAANIVYQYSNDRWTLNKEVFTPSGFMIGTTATDVGLIRNSSGVFDFQAQSGREISFSNVTNGEHMRIDADGNVGINNTNPAYILDVGGNTRVAGSLNVVGLLQSYSGTFNIKNIAQDQDLNLQVNDGGTNTTALTVQGTTANVGIGDTAPQDYLEINGSGKGLGGLTISNSTHNHAALSFARSSTATARIFITEPNATHTSQMYFQTSDASGSAPNLVTAMSIDENQNVGIGTTNPTTPLDVHGIVRVEENSNTAFYGGDYVRVFSNQSYRFRNSGGTAKAQIGMSGNSYFNGGNIGIGTTSPDTLLHLKTTTTDAITTLLKLNGPFVDNDGSEGTAIDFGTATDSSVGARIIGSREEAGARGALRFCTGRESDSGFNNGRMVIDPSGNVGIGITPGAKLHVNSSGTIGWSNLANAFILAGTTSAGIGIDDNEIMAKGSGHLYFGTGGSNEDVVIRAGGTTAAMTISGSNQRVGIAKGTPLARFQVEEYGIDTTGVTTTSTSQAAIHSFPITSFRSARFTIQITNTTDSTYHSTEILAIHDGTTANITEFGEVHTGSSVEATFDADISSGNFRLLATPTSTNSMAFKVVCHSITV